MKDLKHSLQQSLVQLRSLIARYSSLDEGTSFFSNSIVQWLIISVVLLNILLWAAFAFFVGPQDYLIKLQFNAFFGIAAFSQWWAVYVVPGIGFVFFLLNIFLAYWLYFFRERIAAYIILLASFLFHAGAIIATIAIILVNR